MHSCWRLCLVLVLTRLYLSELSGRVVCPCAGSAIAGSSHLFADEDRSPVSLTVQDEPQTSDSVCLSYTTRGDRQCPAVQGIGCNTPALCMDLKVYCCTSGTLFQGPKEQNMHTILC